MTFLEAVNDVLARLREDSVASVTQTDYSALIGKFVNDAKRRVEDAYNWSSLNQTIVLPTVSGTHSYSLTGSGQRFKVSLVINHTNYGEMRNVSYAWMNSQRYLGNPTNSSPYLYAFNGVDASGDTKVDVYPTPDSVYSLRFDLTIPQADLTTGSTVILAPYAPIVQGAYAMALAERGEDQGLASSEAANIYRNTLSDSIAIEASRHCENDCWSAV